MPNPDALWQDIQKLDDLYEELLWDPDDELQFTHDGHKIIITNKTQENNKWNSDSPLRQRSSTPAQQWLVLLQQLVLISPLDRSSLVYGDGTVSNCCYTDGNIRRCCYADTIWRRVKTDTLLYHYDTKLMLYSMSSDENCMNFTTTTLVIGSTMSLFSYAVFSPMLPWHILTKYNWISSSRQRDLCHITDRSLFTV